MARFSDDELRRIAADINKYAQQCTPGAIRALKALVSMLPDSLNAKKPLLRELNKNNPSKECISELADNLTKQIE